MTLSELSVRRPVFATMLVCFVVVLGIFSFLDLGVDLFPRADPATDDGPIESSSVARDRRLKMAAMWSLFACVWLVLLILKLTDGDKLAALRT